MGVGRGVEGGVVEVGGVEGGRWWAEGGWGMARGGARGGGTGSECGCRRAMGRVWAGGRGGGGAGGAEMAGLGV